MNTSNAMSSGQVENKVRLNQTVFDEFYVK